MPNEIEIIPENACANCKDERTTLYKFQYGKKSGFSFSGPDSPERISNLKTMTVPLCEACVFQYRFLIIARRGNLLVLTLGGILIAVFLRSEFTAVLGIAAALIFGIGFLQSIPQALAPKAAIGSRKAIDLFEEKLRKKGYNAFFISGDS